MANPEPPTIVLAIDGLRAAALGAYGQTAYETPAFDALAAASLTFDACYAGSDDPRDFYERLAGASGRAIALLTEEADVTRALAERAERVIELESPHAEAVADRIEATAASAVWSGLAEQMVELVEAGLPELVVIHVRGLRGPWDAPESLHEPLIDEDDPEVIAEVAPPEAAFEDPSSEAACDARFAAACRYAGQVMTLDACLGGWLEVLDGLMEGRSHRLVLLGLRGFSLGEHGVIGPDDPRLFGEQQHAPLFVRSPDPGERFSRRRVPTTLAGAVLACLGEGDCSAETVQIGSRSAEAIVTSDWMLRVGSDQEPELYVKPDDRWEHNDVASLERAVVDELLAKLSRDSGVAAPDRQD